MAGTSLQALKVVYDGDAAPYVRAADQKVLADQRMISSDSARISSIEKAQAAMGRASSAQDKVSATLVNAAAGIFIAKSAYDVLATASDGASSAMGKANAAMMNGAKEAAGFLPSVVADVWQQGIDKLNRYVDLSQKAGTLGTDFYQTLTLGAANAQKSADDYLKVINNIAAALERQLGANGGAQNGGAFNSLATQLQGAGNLSSQTADISRLNNSVTSPEQLAASLKLIQGALDAGEKLVAFKLAGTLLVPEATANLKQDNDALFKMQQSLESVRQSDLIKQADVDRAVSMNVQLANSQKIVTDAKDTIASWFTSSKGDWSALGIEIQQLWINANNNVAGILTYLGLIKTKAQEIADVKPANPEESIWTQIGDFFGGGDLSGRMSDADRAFEIARQRLASQMSNPRNITNAGVETQRADDILSPDLSSTGAIAKANTDLKAYIETQKQAAAAVGQSAGEQERLRAIVQLTAAGIAEGLTPALAGARAEASGLARAAGDAADALDKAQKMRAGTDALVSGMAGIKSQIDNNNIDIKFHGQPGEIARAKAEQQLYNVAIRTMSDEDARAVVANSGLGDAIKSTTDRLAVLNKKTDDSRDALARAFDTVNKYILTTNAAAASVDDGVAAQEKAKVIAQLTAAAQRDGKTNLDQYSASWDALGNKAGAAALSLASAKAQSDANFALQTAGLSGVEAQIAALQHQLHGPDWKNWMDDGLAVTVRIAISLKAPPKKEAANTNEKRAAEEKRTA